MSKDSNNNKGKQKEVVNKGVRPHPLTGSFYSPSKLITAEKLDAFRRIMLKISPELGKRPKEYYLGLIRRVPATKEQLNYSRNLDLHLWSDHPDVDRLVNLILDGHHKGRKKESWRTPLKVILLNLYCNWVDDPKLKTACPRGSNFYNAKSMYNTLGISKTIIKVIDMLNQSILVYQRKGYFDRDTNIGKLTRIWPTDNLTGAFRDADFGVFDIYPSEHRTSVILRKEDINTKKQTDIEYEATNETIRMSRVLSSYNRLLRHSFIDIPTLGDEGINLVDLGSANKLLVSQQSKFVKRVFNRGSFECGGRFFGGWWQRCPKEWRQKIFINDYPTNEIDFSGLHVVLLYAKKRINYWEEVNADPYDIGEIGFLEEELNPRTVAKSLFLMLLNAKTAKKGYSAFRDDQETGSSLKKLKDKELSLIHEKLITKHPEIKEFLGADAGITLMNKDSKITEKIITKFTEDQIPLLSVHDSYIVPQGYEDLLIDTMSDAFEQETGFSVKDNKNAYKEQSTRIIDLERSIEERKRRVNQVNDKEFIVLNNIKNPVRSNRYMYNYDKYNKYRKKRL